MTINAFSYLATVLSALVMNTTSVQHFATKSTDAHFQYGHIVEGRGITGCSGQAVADDVLLTAAHCVKWTNDGRIIYENKAYRYKMLNVDFMQEESFDGPLFVKLSHPVLRNRDKLNVRVLPESYSTKNPLYMRCYPSYKDSAKPGQRYVQEIYKNWAIRYDTTTRYFVSFSPNAWFGCSGGGLYDHQGNVIGVAVTIFFASGINDKVLVSFSAIQPKHVSIMRLLKQPQRTDKEYWENRDLDL